MEGELKVGMAAWLKANPRATLREIEDEMERQLATLRAEVLSGVLTELAEASAGAEQNEEEEGEEECPECGGELVKWGRHERTLETTGGEAVRLERAYMRCPRCGYGVFPPGPQT